MDKLRLKQIPHFSVLMATFCLSCLCLVTSAYAQVEYFIGDFELGGNDQIKIHIEPGKELKIEGRTFFEYPATIRNRQDNEDDWKKLKLYTKNGKHVFLPKQEGKAKYRGERIRIIADRSIDDLISSLWEVEYSTSQLQGESLVNVLSEFLKYRIIPIRNGKHRYLNNCYLLLREQSNKEILKKRYPSPKPAVISYPVDESVKAYKLRLYTSPHVDEPLHELRGDAVFYINGTTIIRDKIPHYESIEIKKVSIKERSELKIRLAPRGFHKLISGKEIVIPYSDWQKAISGNYIKLDQQSLSQLIKPAYDISFSKDFPPELYDKLDDLKLNNQTPDHEGQDTERFFRNLYLDDEDKLILKLGAQRLPIDPDEWKGWRKNNKTYIEIPWSYLRDDPMFKLQVTFKFDQELLDLLKSANGTIPNVFVNTGGHPLQIHYANSSSAVPSIKTIQFGENELIFHRNAYFNRETLSLSASDISGSTVVLDYERIKSALKKHYRITYTSIDGEQLPARFPKLMFSGTNLKKELKRELLEMGETDTFQYKYEVVELRNSSATVEVSRKQVEFDLSCDCEMPLNKWVDEIEIEDPGFNNQFGAHTYTAKPSNDDFSKIKVLLGNRDFKARIYLKALPKGIGLPMQAEEERGREYITAQVDNDSKQIILSACPETLLPIEVVYFDAIEGNDLEIINDKVSKLSEDKSNGAIAGYYLVFAYDDQHIEVFSDADTDFDTRLKEQYGTGSQEIHLNRNYNYRPIQFDEFMGVVTRLYNGAEYGQYIVKRTVFLTDRSKIIYREKENILKSKDINVEDYKSQ